MVNKTVCSSDLIKRKRLPDSASIFTAEVWVIIKALEQIKDSVVIKYVMYTLTFMSPCFTVFEAGTPLNWDCDMKGKK